MLRICVEEALQEKAWFRGAEGRGPRVRTRGSAGPQDDERVLRVCMAGRLDVFGWVAGLHSKWQGRARSPPVVCHAQLPWVSGRNPEVPHAFPRVNATPMMHQAHAREGSAKGYI
jgi:hypothetical protein